ncbi:MAG: beta-ketoacyl synthase N-terminal-like domain-containing protein [Candidatus Tectomicrobia bacterium]
MNQPHDDGRREVVVTGVGIISPYGRGCQAYWQGLSQGHCAIKAIRLFPTEGFRSRIGGEVSADTVRTLGATSRSRANRFVVAAAEEAVCRAMLAPEALATAAVSIGGAGGGMLEAETWYWARYGAQENVRLRTALRSTFPTMQTEAVACRFKIGGPRETPILACSSSAAAITTVADLIASGTVDVGLAGGVETLTWQDVAWHQMRFTRPPPQPMLRGRYGRCMRLWCGLT